MFDTPIDIGFSRHTNLLCSPFVLLVRREQCHGDCKSHKIRKALIDQSLCILIVVYYANKQTNGCKQKHTLCLWLLSLQVADSSAEIHVRILHPLNNKDAYIAVYNALHFFLLFQGTSNILVELTLYNPQNPLFHYFYFRFDEGYF